jgi:hypothetical protein
MDTMDKTTEIITTMIDICKELDIDIKGYTVHQTNSDNWDIDFGIIIKCPCRKFGQTNDSCKVTTLRAHISLKYAVTDTFWYDLTHNNLTIHTKMEED